MSDLQEPEELAAVKSAPAAEPRGDTAATAVTGAGQSQKDATPLDLPEDQANIDNSNADSSLAVPSGQKSSDPDPGLELISIDLEFVDAAGHGIVDLVYRVSVGKEVNEGSTDVKGKCKSMEGIKPNLALKIEVKRDDGRWSTKYTGFTACADMNICATSPHIKLEVSTEEHQGAPAKVDPSKPAPEKPLVPKPPLPMAGQIKSALTTAKPKPRICRNEHGEPFAEFSKGDWVLTTAFPAWGVWRAYTEYNKWRKAEDERSRCEATGGVVATSAKSRTPPVASAEAGTASPAALAPAPRPKALPSSADSKPMTQSVTDINQPPPLAVTQLVQIMEEQATWKWKQMFEVEKMTSKSIADGVSNKSYEPATGKEPGETNGRCYPSVKVGLMRAALVAGFGSDIPAKGAGPWLTKNGYVDVSSKIPDARWAAPGDIVVYRYDDQTEASNLEVHKVALKKYQEDVKAHAEAAAKWETDHAIWQETKKSSILAAASVTQAKSSGKPTKVKLPTEPKKPVLRDPPDDHNYGHIDVRTYDGYISDFKTTRSPVPAKRESRKGFVVIGVYRKVSDPLADIRVRAFLKVLREWENHGIEDDAKRYFALQLKPGDKTQPFFTDTSTHPFASKPKERGSFSGAYQMAYSTWKELVDLGMPLGFTPALQDQYAVAKIEGRQALGLIRQGRIKEAVTTTSLPKEWSSLPGGVDARKGATLDDLIACHKEFMLELLR